MVYAWEDVREDICRQYSMEGKPLTQVKAIMLRDKGFTASTRSYRSKIAEWNVKRADLQDNADGITLQAVQRQSCSLSPIFNDIDNFGSPDTDHTLVADHDVVRFGNDSNHSYEMSMDALFRPVSNYEQSCMARDEQFRQVVERMHQTPSKSAAEYELREGDFYGNDGTLLHYIASRRYMEGIMEETLRFCARYRFSLNDVNSASLTALQIALSNDRAQNVKLLLSSGAAMPAQNHIGESPLHVAIMNTNNPEIVDLLLNHCYQESLRESIRQSLRAQTENQNEARIPVDFLWKETGQMALDLLVGRVLQELSLSGETHCTEVTKQILKRIVDLIPKIDDTSYLREQARNDHVLFSRATIAIGRHRGALDLSSTMMMVLREETATLDPRFYQDFCHNQRYRRG